MYVPLTAQRTHPHPMVACGYAITGAAPRHAIHIESHTLHNLFDAVCMYFNISPDELRSHTRTQQYVIPRQIFCYMAGITQPNDNNDIHALRGAAKNKLYAQRLFACTDSDIAAYIHHERSNVVYARQQVANQLSIHNPAFETPVNELCALLGVGEPT